jgi:hypothetical protein
LGDCVIPRHQELTSRPTRSRHNELGQPLLDTRVFHMMATDVGSEVRQLFIHVAKRAEFECSRKSGAFWIAVSKCNRIVSVSKSTTVMQLRKASWIHLVAAGAA